MTTTIELPSVIKGQGVGYLVASNTHAGAYWLVSTDAHGALVCTCPATVPRCRHMREAVAFWSEEDRQAKARRPNLPPAPGGRFVD